MTMISEPTKATRKTIADPVNVIMVSYMRPNDLERSATSILNNTAIPIKLTILDNSTGVNDHVLDRLCSDTRVAIIYNPMNYGKAKCYNMYLDTILTGDENDFFVSVDADIEVKARWLDTLIDDSFVLAENNFGMLAPTYVDRLDSDEIPEKPLVHQMIDTRNVQGGVYYNKRLGGGLLLINKRFYHEAGGFDPEILYGGDDGRLCNAALRLNKFIGFTTNVRVKHLRYDETVEYQTWKRLHLNDKVIKHGHWD